MKKNSIPSVSKRVTRQTLVAMRQMAIIIATLDNINTHTLHGRVPDIELEKKREEIIEMRRRREKCEETKITQACSMA